jgi:hypothetical protein
LSIRHRSPPREVRRRRSRLGKDGDVARRGTPAGATPGRTPPRSRHRARASGIRRHVCSSKIRRRCCRSLPRLAQPPSPPGLGSPPPLVRFGSAIGACPPAIGVSSSVARLGAPPPLAPGVAATRTPEETAITACSPEGTATPH